MASASGVTDITFTPDGRMLVAKQPGVITILDQGGTLIKQTALDLRGSACSTIDRGLQSVAVDPAFPTNHYIYVYYTSNKNGTCADNIYPNGPVNRLSRFVLSDDNNVDPLSEAVLVDNIPSMYLHQGGDIAFGKDGYLYVTVGDGNCDYAGDSGCESNNDAARDTNTLLGKVLRLTAPDGGIPPDNPYTGPDSDRCNTIGVTGPGRFCQETYASGLRNPWRFAFDPNASGTRFFVNDVGQTAWEEIDLGEKGADYGWNVREGHCVTDSLSDCGPPPAGLTNPIYDYDHLTGCGSITGGAFVPNDVWRQEDAGAYVFADFDCGKIFELTPSGGGAVSVSELLSGMGANTLVATTFGPYAGGQALYYSSWTTTEIRRLAFTGIRSLSLSPRSGTALAGDQYCVTATLVDAEGHPRPGISVVFSVSGANSNGASPISSDQNGHAQFCYTGADPGADTILAFADTNANSSKDPGEPSDTASMIWTSVPYARPKGAALARASLVVAYQSCTLGNSVHGLPLNYQSCTPARQASSFLTVGTADANGAPTNAVGSVRYETHINASPTPNDVAIRVMTTDVRCQSPASTTCGGANTAAGPDYSGQLQATTALQLTDKSNSPGGTGTSQDFSFPVVVPCVETTSPSIGATCTLWTTANSVVPGSVKSGKRAIWQMGQIQVLDGGSAGVADASDATLFETQGIFVP